MVLKRLLLLVVALCFSPNVSAYNYTVIKGDTLNELSRKFKIAVSELKRVNGLKRDKIYAGHIIFIPESVGELDHATADNSNNVQYTVVRGDTLLEIADKFGVSINDLKSANNLNKDKIKIGQILIIPSFTLTEHKVNEPQNEVKIPDGMHNDQSSSIQTPEPLPPIQYIVKKGDTLNKIASNFGVTVNELMHSNGLSSTRLKPGVILKITSTGTNGIIRNMILEKPSIKYIVEDGDSIEELSKRFDVPIDSIKGANQITDNTVKAGEILIIPDSKYEKEPAIQVGTMTDETRHQDFNIPNALNRKSLDEKVDYYYEQTRHTDNNFNLIANRIINTALMFLGVPYKFGGNSPSTGLDCSAYVKKVFGILNIELPRTARDIYHVGRYVQKSQLATGDLVFFRTYARYPSHVGIYLGDNKFIHASSRSKMVTIDDLDFNYYKKRYIGAKRIEPAGLFYDELSKNQMVFELN
jgi:peptidoglycan DL-endopeptidase LytE